MSEHKDQDGNVIPIGPDAQYRHGINYASRQNAALVARVSEAGCDPAFYERQRFETYVKAAGDVIANRDTVILSLASVIGDLLDLVDEKHKNNEKVISAERLRYNTLNDIGLVITQPSQGLSSHSNTAHTHDDK